MRRFAASLTVLSTLTLACACGPIDDATPDLERQTAATNTGGGPGGATITTVASGSGWRKLSATGTMLDQQTGTYRTVTNDIVFVVTGTTGIASVPLPTTIRGELSTDLQQSLASGEIGSANEAVYFVHKATAEQVAAGTLQTATTKTQVGVKTYALCGDYNKTLQKTVSFDEQVNKSKSWSSGGFSGQLTLNGRVKGMTTGKVNLRIKRSWCVPYWAKLIDVRFNGNLEATGRLIAKGSFAKQWGWSSQVAKFHVGSFSTFIGPLWVHVGLNVPVDLGLEADTKATADLDGTVKASGSFDLICTGDGCGGNKSFTHSFTSNNVPSFSLSGRAKVRPWIQGSVRAYLYSDGVAYGQIGVKAYLEGDLWAYLGNSCGDADNDGVNETVDALTLSADVGLDLTARLYVVSILNKKWSWPLGRWHVGFWDLLPGGSSAAEPIFYRKFYEPGTVALPPGGSSGVPFLFRMRPCWPYTDNVKYRFNWKDGTTTTVWLKPYILYTTTHAFNGSLPGTVTLTAVKDAHGRSINKSTDAKTSNSTKPTFPGGAQEVKLTL